MDYKEKKRLIRAALNRVIEHRKRQRQNIEESILKAIDDDIKAAKLVLSGQKDIKVFISDSEKRGEYILNFWR